MINIPHFFVEDTCTFESESEQGVGGMRQEDNIIIPSISEPEYERYDPFCVVNHLYSNEVENDSVDGILRNIITKYLLAGNPITFEIESINNFLMNTFQKMMDSLASSVLRQMIKHSVEKQENQNRVLIDVLFITWYLAFMPAQRRIEINENTINLRPFKYILGGIHGLVSKKGFIDTYIELKDRDIGIIYSHVFNRAALSIFTFLYHLNYYGVLNNSIEHYYQWLTSSGYRWSKLLQYEKPDEILDCFQWVIPEGLPTLGGKRFYYVFGHLNEFEDYFLNNYSDCKDVIEAIDTLMNSKQREYVRSLYDWKYVE